MMTKTKTKYTDNFDNNLKEKFVLNGFFTFICRCLTSKNMVQVLFCEKTQYWRSPPTHNKLRMGRLGVRLVRLLTSLENHFFLYISHSHVVNSVVRHTLYCITTALPCYRRKLCTRAYRGTLATLREISPLAPISPP